MGARCPGVGLLNGAEFTTRDGRKARQLFVDPDVKDAAGNIITTIEARLQELAAAIEEKRAEIGAAPEDPLPATVEGDSPSGGKLIVYLVPWDAFPEEGFGMKVALIPGVDIPIQSVVEPTARSGKEYRWRPSKAIYEREPAWAAQGLVALLKGAARKRAAAPLDGFDNKYCDKWSIRRAITRFKALEDIPGTRREARFNAIVASLNDGVTLAFVLRIEEKHVCWADEHHADPANESFEDHVGRVAAGRLKRGIPLGISHPRYIEKRAAAERAEFLKTEAFDLSEEQAAALEEAERIRAEKAEREKADPGRDSFAKYIQLDEALRKRDAAEATYQRVVSTGDGVATAKAEYEKAEAEYEGAKAAEKAEQPGVNPGGGINFRDARVKRAPYVMKGWLHRGETVQWFGPPGAGKSASLLSVMLASAAPPPEGATFAGCRIKRGLAIFAAYERAGETQDRIVAAKKRWGCPTTCRSCCCLAVSSQTLMAHSYRVIRRMRYGTDSTRERHNDRGGPSSDTT
jgi:hypothetical protein